MQAKVKWFNKEKGFGFLEALNDNDENMEKDIFVHYSAILGEGYKELEEGQLVNFELSKTDKGDQAKEVSIVK